MSKKDNDKEKEPNTGMSKTFIGIAGAIIGAAGVAAWNHRDKIKESTLSAKERAIELKEKSNRMIESIKEKVQESKQKETQYQESKNEEATIFLLSAAEVEVNKPQNESETLELEKQPPEDHKQ